MRHALHVVLCHVRLHGFGRAHFVPYAGMAYYKCAHCGHVALARQDGR